MNAIGTDQDVAPRGRTLRAVTVEEIRGHAAFVLAKRPQSVSGMDAGFAEPRPYRLPDDRLQPAAVDGELRDIIARVRPAQLAPDLLPEPIGVEQLVGSNADRVEPLEQPELRELLDRMRQGVDADPELADGIRQIVDFAVDTARMQHQRRRKTPNAATDNDDLHDPTRKTTHIWIR